MSANRKRCFVIMPFSTTSPSHTSQYWNNHFERFLKPAIESSGEFEAFRSEPLRQDITRQIVTDLVFSPIVVAELTDNNPNVYWELGIRQSFRHGTVTVAEKGSEIPFDIASKGVLFYCSQDTKREDKFRRQLGKALADCVSHPERPDSIVLETITGRGSVYAVIHHRELVQRMGGLISEYQINQAILDQIYKTIREGKGKRLSFIRGKQSVVTRLGSSAIDLLLAEHYLEESSEFYQFAHAFLVLVSSMNHHLSIWNYAASKGVEKYFLERESFIEDSFRQYANGLDAARKRLLPLV